MKPYDEMTYDEQEEYLDFAEAEYCPMCYGKKHIAKYRFIGDGMSEITGWETCPRCLGTGRA